MLSFIIFIFFFGLLLFAAYYDLFNMKIPNWVSVALLVGFFVVAPFVIDSWDVFFQHLMVGVAVFALTFALFAVGGFGAGDSKLMAATAFWWQWMDLATYLLYSAVAGGALSILIIIARSKRLQSLPLFSKIPSIFKDPEEGKRRMIPYGVALAIGALLTLPRSAIFKSAAGLG